jgi:hypothetical protein
VVRDVPNGQGRHVEGEIEAGQDVGRLALEGRQHDPRRGPLDALAQRRDPGERRPLQPHRSSAITLDQRDRDPAPDSWRQRRHAGGQDRPGIALDGVRHRHARDRDEHADAADLERDPCLLCNPVPWTLPMLAPSLQGPGRGLQVTGG